MKKQFSGQLLSRAWLLALLCLLLSAGSLGAATADDFRTEEYRAMHSLDSINAAHAYALGFTGKGVTVAVIDSGARSTHQEFRQKQDYQVEYYIVPNDQDHGVHVTGTIAEDKDNQGMHGVAFEAGLLSMVAVDGKSFNPDYPAEFTAIAELEHYPQVRIVSNSWAAANHKSGSLAYFSSWDKDDIIFYDALAQELAQAIDERDVLFVFGTANNGLPAPSMAAAMLAYLSGTTLAVDYTYSGNTLIPAADPELGDIIKNNLIGVMAFDPGALEKWGTSSLAFVAPFSNLADGAKEYSLLAPGGGYILHLCRQRFRLRSDGRHLHGHAPCFRNGGPGQPGFSLYGRQTTGRCIAVHQP